GSGHLGSLLCRPQSIDATGQQGPQRRWQWCPGATFELRAPLQGRSRELFQEERGAIGPRQEFLEDDMRQRCTLDVLGHELQRRSASEPLELDLVNVLHPSGPLGAWP